MAPMASMNASRNLANILADSAEYAQLTGDDAAALERVRDVMHLAASIRQDDNIVPQLVSMGIDAMGCNALMTIAPALRLDETSSPAARASARAIIDDLLDERTLRDGIRRSFVFERALHQEVRQTAAAGAWVVRPLADQQLVRDHRNFDLMLEALAAAPDKPQFVAATARLTVEHSMEDPAPAGERRFRNTPRYSRWYGDDWHYDRYLETSFRVIGERRMTAVSLAAQRFRADHRRWPNTLDELVPRYLPKVPPDPFAQGDQVGYVIQRGVLSNSADRPLLFSRCGEVDARPYPEPSYSWENNRLTGPNAKKTLWQYRDLSRFAPAPPASQPSTQAVDDQP
jgi:hypothetical protein